MPPRLLDDPGIYGGCQVYADSTPDQLAARGVERAGDPPCDEFGFVDTVAVYGGWASFGSEEMAAVSNQYAAMPSMHIGWSTWCALVLAPLMRRRWLRALAIAYPALTLFCIMVTGNHYWIDGVGGLVCLGAGYLVARLATTAWEARRGAVAPRPRAVAA
jgi:membrane-associated phospholipid phosphatase